MVRSRRIIGRVLPGSHEGSEMTEDLAIESNGVELKRGKWFWILADASIFSAVTGARPHPRTGTGSAAARSSVCNDVPRGAVGAIMGSFPTAIAGAMYGGAAPTGATASAMSAGRGGTRSAAAATSCAGEGAGAAAGATGRAARPTTDVNVCSDRFSASNGDGISSMDGKRCKVKPLLSVCSSECAFS